VTDTLRSAALAVLAASSSREENAPVTTSDPPTPTSNLPPDERYEALAARAPDLGVLQQARTPAEIDAENRATMARTLGPTKNYTLPSGKRASSLRRLQGKHQRDALRLVGKDQASLPYALIAIATTIDGRAITYEDVLEFELDDVNELMAQVLGGKGSSPSAR
jgi:hypothetical protein